jgi:hypothetical protein
MPGPAGHAGYHPGQIQHPADNVETRDLARSQALPGSQIMVVGVLRRRIQFHQITMPRGRPL